MAAGRDPHKLHVGEARTLCDGAVRFSVQEDEQGRQYLTLVNAPFEPYLVERAHDGYEFVVGGDMHDILEHLSDMLVARPQQRWHVVAISESSIQLSEAPRWPRWPCDLAMQGTGAQQQLVHNNAAVQSRQACSPTPFYSKTSSIGAANNPTQQASPLTQADSSGAPWATSNDGHRQGLEITGRTLDRTGHETDHAFTQNDHSNSPWRANDSQHSMVNTSTTDNSVQDGQGNIHVQAYNVRGNTNLADHHASQDSTVVLNGVHQPCNGQSQGVNVPANLHSAQGGAVVQNGNFNGALLHQDYNIPAAHDHMSTHAAVAGSVVQEKDLHQLTRDSLKMFENFEAWQRRQGEIANILDADEVFGVYTGTSLCRWCGLEGHEAVDCIKFDPTHFDKLVCVACNNKKHSIDECEKFTTSMTQDEQATLILSKGVNLPGVRSFFYPWTAFLDAENHDLTPLSRAYLKSIVANDKSRDWVNLWKTWNYDGSCDTPYSPEGHHRQPNWHFVDDWRRNATSPAAGDLDETFAEEWPLIRRGVNDEGRELSGRTEGAAGPSSQRDVQATHECTDEHADGHMNEHAGDPMDADMGT